ncbi:MAG: sigma-70 family RNA polymerase sigma factor [Planctomycetaceae bacterium]|nr:sigma-70 family RNA polymerase sigma factor [Planctomycetaceae bacterium]
MMEIVTQEFPETRWSQLLELRDPSHPRYAEHLERLAKQYWSPVFHYAQALRKADAEDLTQQFFAMLLARHDLEKLSPERGSFRGFLKTALRNFVQSAGRAASLRATVPIPEGTDFRTPEQAFDREWARGVLAEAVARLRKESARAAFDIFREYCLEDSGASYADLARRHKVGEDDVRNRLREARLRLREIIEELLRDYLLPGQDVDAELRFILSK